MSQTCVWPSMDEQPPDRLPRRRSSSSVLSEGRPQLRRLFSAGSIDAPASAALEPVAVLVERNVTFGFSIAGSNRNPAGVYVAHVEAGTPAAETGKMRQGQKILRINGRDVSEASKRQVAQLLREANMLSLKLIYDPQGFAKHDAGHELRQASLACLQRQISSKSLDGDSTTCKIEMQVNTLLGPIVTEDMDSDRLRQALYMCIHSARGKRAKRKLMASLELDRIQLVPEGQDAGEPTELLFVDVVHAEPAGKLLALIAQELPPLSEFGVQGSRQYATYVVRGPSRKRIQAFYAHLKQRLSSSFQLIRSEMSQQPLLADIAQRRSTERLLDDLDETGGDANDDYLEVS